MTDKELDVVEFLAEAEATLPVVAGLLDRVGDDGEVILTPDSEETAAVAQLAEQWVIFRSTYYAQQKVMAGTVESFMPFLATALQASLDHDQADGPRP